MPPRRLLALAALVLPLAAQAQTAPAAVQMPVLRSTDGSVEAPPPRALCLAVRAPNDPDGSLVRQASIGLAAALRPHGYTVLPEDAACTYRVRLTLIRNLNAQLQLLSVGMVAHAARVQLAEDVAAPLNALVAERGLSAEGRATAQRLRRDADTYERFLGTDVSSVSGGLVAGLGRLAGRLHTALLAGAE